MHDTQNLDNTGKDYRDAVDNMVETLSDTTILHTQTQLDDLRDRFKEALDDTES